MSKTKERVANESIVSVLRGAADEYAARHNRNQDGNQEYGNGEGRRPPALESDPDMRVVRLSLDDVFPSPLNTRKRIDPDKLQGLADNIREVGVRQAILVRPRSGGEITALLGEPGAPGVTVYEIVVGERRYRASLLAGRTTIPAVVEVMDDKQFLMLNMTENVQRDDLDAIETAQGYRAMIEAGWTQQEIADKFGRTQPVVAKTLALLGLPPDVQDLIARDGSGLSASHGNTLLRWKNYPQAVSKMAAYIADNKISSHAIEKKMPSNIGFILKGEGKQIGWDAPFKETHCKACPFGAFVPDNGYDLCLHPAHLEELKAQAAHDREAAAKERGEQSRRALEMSQAALAKARQGPAQPPTLLAPPPENSVPVPAAETLVRSSSESDSEEPTSESTDADIAEQSVVDPLPSIRDLDYGSYVTVDMRPPAGCDTACPCLGLCRDRDGQTEQKICTDPKRYQRLSQAEERAKTQKKRSRLQPRLDRVAELLGDTEAPDLRAGGTFAVALAVVVRDALANKGSGAANGPLKEFQKSAGLSLKAEELTGYDAEQPDAWEALACLDVPALIRLGFLVLGNKEIEAKLRYEPSPTRRLDFFTQMMVKKAASDPAQTEESSYRKGDRVLVFDVRPEGRGVWERATVTQDHHGGKVVARLGDGQIGFHAPGHVRPADAGLSEQEERELLHDGEPIEVGAEGV